MALASLNCPREAISICCQHVPNTPSPSCPITVQAGRVCLTDQDACCDLVLRTSTLNPGPFSDIPSPHKTFLGDMSSPACSVGWRHATRAQNALRDRQLAELPCRHHRKAGKSTAPSYGVADNFSESHSDTAEHL
jgi:hypothetical protein